MASAKMDTAIQNLKDFISVSCTVKRGDFVKLLTLSDMHRQGGMCFLSKNGFRLPNDEFSISWYVAEKCIFITNILFFYLKNYHSHPKGGVTMIFLITSFGLWAYWSNQHHSRGTNDSFWKLKKIGVKIGMVYFTAQNFSLAENVVLRIPGSEQEIKKALLGVLNYPNTKPLH